MKFAVALLVVDEFPEEDGTSRRYLEAMGELIKLRVEGSAVFKFKIERVDVHSDPDVLFPEFEHGSD